MTVSHDADFAQRIVDLDGEAGRAWLADLPALVRELSGRWSIEIGAPVPRLSYNYVAHALRPDGTPAIFKAGVPSVALTSEMTALRRYGGKGAVRLLKYDEAAGVMLLERAMPGSTLLELRQAGGDPWATEVAASVMRSLKAPAVESDKFRTVGSWLDGFARLRERFAGTTGPFPRGIVERAEGLSRELLDSMSEPVLLHGDLHHENILDGGDFGFLAIDPKGVIGEQAYESGAYLRNPLPEILNENPVGFHLDRICVLADGIGVSRRRVRDWAIAQAVLSAWWSFEDHGGGWEPAIRLAELLARIHLR